HEWEEGLDIDDSDLLLTPVVCPTNNPDIVPEITTTTQTLILAQNHQVNANDECPAGIVQTAKLRKIADTQEGEEESVMSTQEYIRKVIEDVGEDADFMRASWLRVLDYVNEDGGIMTGCFGDVKKFLLRMGNFRKLLQLSSVVLQMRWAISQLHSKTFSGTISDTIHYKVLLEERFAKVITVGEALILHNVSVFSPTQSTHH
ncbi:hypothetical protein Tco_1464302, partial [Tanacetum coccineum]